MVAANTTGQTTGKEVNQAQTTAAPSLNATAPVKEASPTNQNEALKEHKRETFIGSDLEFLYFFAFNVFYILKFCKIKNLIWPLSRKIQSSPHTEYTRN